MGDGGAMKKPDAENPEMREAAREARLRWLRCGLVILAFFLGLAMGNPSGVLIVKAAYEWGRDDQRLHDLAIATYRERENDQRRARAWTACGDRPCPDYERAIERHMEAGSLATAIRHGVDDHTIEIVVRLDQERRGSCERIIEFYGTPLASLREGR